MGVVWRARDEILKRDVAVKELVWPPYFTEAEQQTACRRAAREAQMAGRLAHLNVVRIYDILQEDGHPWVIMELLPYPSLHDLVREGPLSPARAARIGLGVLAALRAAHAEGVLHRDVKPANILVGSDGRVVLTDFGIARAVDSTTLTTADGLVGSPSYIAPERARGGQSGPPADLWGLGASLYTATEGHPPFERDAALATLTAVVVDEPDEALHAGSLWPVISGLLRKEPAERLDAADTEAMLREIADEGEATPVVPALQRASPAPSPTAIGESAAAATTGAESGAGDPVRSSAWVRTGVESATAAPPEPDTSTAPEASAASTTPWPAEASGPAAAAVRSSGQPSSTADLPAKPASRRPHWLRRPAVALVGVAAVGAVATAVAFALTSSPGGPAASPGVSSPSASHLAKSRGTSTPRPTVSASPSAPGSSAGAAKGGSANYGALPTGYYRFTNSTGFSIGVPNGWRISHVGHYVYITDPSNSGIFLLIDQSDTPKPNPLADWEQQAASREGTYPDYHLIRLASVDYPQAEKAADWEFTYDRNGVPVHILNRNVLANAHHAYALYWSTPADDWSADYHYFQAFADTFRPAQ